MSAAGESRALAQTRQWVERVVAGLNLCPFAHPVLRAGTLHYALSEAHTLAELLADLARELTELAHAAPADRATTLLVVPEGLASFEDYLDVLALAEAALAQLGLEGEIQIAGFHPDYRFGDGQPGDHGLDPADYSNRSPWPMFHLIREADVAQASGRHPDVAQVPVDNARRLRALGTEELERMLAACRQGAEAPRP